ncbi:PF06945 family protein [Leptospira licerasiae serovar Varillal str. VAR 010]|uniref:PF06945 family protein n=2 Tax=Leptospira licerasiae TaxID=447106 RepID=A0ABP2RGQ2_9LEPT|nr:PF06945 family protein [Leptospira licerasiae serovar Varillal str. VAR 010]EJZ43677.1 PF06945 family protein [Leptospira licerasiae str. MMD4847]
MDHETGLCEGCYRTLEEIGRWTMYSEDERKSIRLKIEERKISLGKTSFKNP